MTDEPTTMGDYLRAARRRRRISIERASEETRIRADFLMRMESDEFDFMAAAYVRGFLRNYARFLRLDPQPLLEDFDRRFGTGPVTTEIVNLSRRKTKPAREPRPLPRWLGPALAIVGLIGLLALIGLAAGDESDDRPEPVASLDTASPTPPPKTTPPKKSNPRNGGGLFRDGIEVEIIAVYARSWVEVESDGRTVFGRVLEEGESETFRAKDAMTLIFGFPDGVEMIVNGRHIGTPSGGGAEALEITLPEDFETL